MKTNGFVGIKEDVEQHGIRDMHLPIERHSAKELHNSRPSTRRENSSRGILLQKGELFVELFGSIPLPG